MSAGAEKVRVLILGCGDLGTGAAHTLVRAGFEVVVVEKSTPDAVRRRVAFSEAARVGAIEVEGVWCRRSSLAQFESQGLPPDAIALFVEPPSRALQVLRPQVLVDARLTKSPLQIEPPAGVFVVALGPGPVAGQDCDAVIETQRGPDLGRVIAAGSAAADTGVPGLVGGVAAPRLLRAPASGKLRLMVELGDVVRAGQVLAQVDGVPVRAQIDGLLRGMLADGDAVEVGQKLGDVDPRVDAPAVDRISDKSLTVGGGVLAAICAHFDLDPERTV